MWLPLASQPLNWNKLRNIFPSPRQVAVVSFVSMACCCEVAAVHNSHALDRHADCCLALIVDYELHRLGYRLTEELELFGFCVLPRFLPINWQVQIVYIDKIKDRLYILYGVI
jgi:hypothetical protein